MKKCLGFIIILMVPIFLLASCGAPKYVHKDPAFSYEYPSGYKAEPLQLKDEVARFANQNQYKIPVYTASVADKVKGAKLEDVPAGVVETMKKNYPAASRFKILEQKIVKLSDGSDAVAWKLKWKWIDGVSFLQSGAVNAFQGDKLITIVGTTVFGGDTSLDKLVEQCMTLKLKQ